MAKKTCPACGAPVSPGEEFCKYCGALVPHNEGNAAQAAQVAQAAQAAPDPHPEQPSRRVQTPKTMDELLAFCERHDLPLSKMRFFIGLDYPGARAFGIYKDTNGDFVVYKNKADGSRAVRYRGPDEAYAVNELFQKLKEEASSQRARVSAARSPGYPPSSAHDSNPYNSLNSQAGVRRPAKRKANKLLIVLLAAAAAITIGRTAAAISNQTPHPSTGYYYYNNHYYYNQNSDWYLYSSDIDSWYPIYTVDDELTDHYADYYASYSYDDGFGVEDFSDSGFYDSSSYSGSSSSYSSDWDSSDDWDWDDDDDWDSSDDWDWDSDWDSDWTDWDSDW